MPTVAKAYNMIRQEEKQREGFALKFSVSTALSAHSNNYRNFHNNGFNNGGRNRRNYSGNYSQDEYSTRNSVNNGNATKRIVFEKGIIDGNCVNTTMGQNVNAMNMSMGPKVNAESVNTSSQQSEVAMCARMNQLQNQLNQMMLMMQNNKDSFGMSLEDTPKLIAAFTTTRYRTKSYSQAAKDQRWIDAMNKELQALKADHTWTLTLLPPNKKAIGCKWVYKIKLHSDGTVERYKARLVAQGFTQQEGIDYTETFASFAKMVTVRTLLVVVVYHNWYIAQLDINNAFLHDTSLLAYRKGTDFLALIIYVDDVLLTRNNITLIKYFKRQLDLTFSIKDLGNLSYYLGIEFLWNSKGLTMSQRKYALEFRETENVLNLKPCHIPVDPIIKLNDTDGEPLNNHSLHRAIVGKLLYLTITRPDLSYAAHALSQFSHSLRTPYWKALIKVTTDEDLQQAHRTIASVPELNMQLTHMLNELEAEKKRTETLDEMRKTSRSQFWWEAPIEELNLHELEQLKESMEELKKTVALQANKLFTENSSALSIFGVDHNEMKPTPVVPLSSSGASYVENYGYGHDLFSSFVH
nr:cysteine-rich RLK (receptor-like protein kinase) 8 [Tanacetum cinerariifolium]